MVLMPFNCLWLIRLLTDFDWFGSVLNKFQRVSTVRLSISSSTGLYEFQKVTISSHWFQLEKGCWE